MWGILTQHYVYIRLYKVPTNVGVNPHLLEDIGCDVYMPINLHSLPKFRDSWSYLYVEHCKIEQDAKAVALFDEKGKTPVPCANLNLIMLGPGTSISHKAIQNLAENGCMIMWTGEQGVRLYAFNIGETRSAHHILHQARLVSDPKLRLQVVKRMYILRFKGKLDSNLNIQQMRGMEGARIKQKYAEYSKLTGVEWTGRKYKTTEWNNTSPVNKALSTANSCLYGLCHAAIIATGYSPALGFIHTGNQLSFVFDIADLYKSEITIPLAFNLAKENSDSIEKEARYACRSQFFDSKLLQRIIPDIQAIVNLSIPIQDYVENQYGKYIELDENENYFKTGGLWDPDQGEISGGKNYDDRDEVV